MALGFVAREVDYELLEEETLELEFLTADDGGLLGRRLSYPLRRRTTEAPLVGRRTRDRRVAGKSYLVRHAAGGLLVTDTHGTPSHPKEVREVARSCFAVGRRYRPRAPTLGAGAPAPRVRAR